MLTKYKNYKVWYSNKGYPLIWVDSKEVKLHVYVWEQVNGSKPKGYDIHHIDKDKGNYKLENLQLLTPTEHSRVHAGWIMKDGKWIAKKCNNCKGILELDKFYTIKTRNIVSNFCRECSKDKGSLNRKKYGHKEKHKLYCREWRRKRSKK